MTLGSEYNGALAQVRAGGANLTDTVVDTLVRWPMRVTEATMDYMLGTKTTSSNSSGAGAGAGAGSSWTSAFSGDQDLSGNDLKYVFWSIVFTKPGHETVLQPQQEELVNYSADANTYAATKIARLLDNARHGHVQKPASWTNYPGTSSSKSTQSAASPSNDKGWRVPPEDQKYVVLLYRVERRLPRQEEARRIEHITVERDTRVV